MAVWREDARELYFKQGFSISQIAEDLGKDRKTISSYLSSLPDFEVEKMRRKAETKARRKEYQRNWDAVKRIRPAPAYETVNRSIERQHDIDVRVLSAERF